MKLNRKKLGYALAAGILVAGVATAASASIPDSPSGEFHVCIQTNRSANSQYTMYVVDPDLQTAHNGSCNTGYTEYTLNQQGPKGDKGDPGPAGPTKARHLEFVSHTVPQGTGQDVYQAEQWDDEFNVLSAGVVSTDFAPAGPSAVTGSAPHGYTAHGQTTWRFQFKRDPNQDYLVELEYLVEEK